MRPFNWTDSGLRLLFEALRLRSNTTSVFLRNPKQEPVYFLRGYLETLFARWCSGVTPWTRVGQRSIANVGKVRGPSGGPKGPSGGGSGVIKPGSSAASEGLSESFVAHIARRYAYKDTPAATLSRQSIQRVLALRQCVPLLGFAGLCLVDKPSVITPDEELEGVCFEIRKIFDKVNFDISNREILPLPTDTPVKLANFELGDPIAKGCNAVVYSARLRQPEEMANIARPMQIPTIGEESLDAIEPESPPLSSSPPRKYDAALETPAGSFDEPAQTVQVGPLGPHDLALKMMFNYDAESNAAAIWQSLSRECASLQAPGSSPGQPANQLTSSMASAMSANRDAELPPHPCIVDIKAAFVDRVPLLRGATQLYPVALPPRLHEQGIGRNATMFLVMKRYHCSLRDYLSKNFVEGSHRPDHVRLSLCAQMFEAVTHLVSHGVAHRDMKSDNILVEVTEQNDDRSGEPRIALTDFGCCLTPADCITNLKLAFISGQILRGGNVALMAPEVQSAKPGLLSFIDYSKADLWSAATLVYEIYGQKNPFYDGTLRSATYEEDQLPEIEGAPAEVRALVAACLRRDPALRPQPAMAATALQLLLFAPKRLLKASLGSGERTPAGQQIRDVVEWLCDVSVDSLFAARREEHREKPCTADQMLKRVFLGRVQLQTVLDALKFIQEVRLASGDDAEQPDSPTSGDEGGDSKSDDPVENQ